MKGPYGFGCYCLCIPIAAWVSTGCEESSEDGGLADAALDAVDDGALATDGDLANPDRAGPDGDEDTGETQDVSPYCPVRDYEPCGGDLLGRWSLVALCPEDSVNLYESGFEDVPECVGDGNEILGGSEVAGTFEFHEEGQVSFEVSIEMQVTVVFTDRCLEAAEVAGDTPTERCAAMNRERSACEYAPDACRCVGDPELVTEEHTASYTVTDNEVALGEDPPATYCVEGDSLIMDYYLWHPVSWRYWVFERL